MKYKVGDVVRTTKNIDPDGMNVFPIGTIGVVEVVDDDSLPYRIHAGNESLWYLEDMLEPYPNGKSYEQGLADAWETLKAIGELTDTKRKDIFGCITVRAMIKTLSLDEVMKKFKAYEDSKTIKVGDEVQNITTGNTYWIVAIDREVMHGYSSSAECKGYPVQKFPTSDIGLIKTGRTTDAVELLKQPKGE